MKKIRLLVLENIRLLREGIAALLNGQPDFTVVVTFGNVERIIDEIKSLKFDIVLLDIGERNPATVEIIQLIKKKIRER